MEYRVGDKKVRIYPQYLDEIGSGYEGISYKYRGKVLKLYYDRPKKDVLSYAECEYMKKLNTKRILLPCNSVIDKHHYMRGYIIEPYIDNEIYVYGITGEKFLNERKLIHDELIYLGEKFISVYDFDLNNFKVSDKFYFLDPGSYDVHWDMMNDDAEKYIIYLANTNIDYFESFLYNEIFLRRARKYINDYNLYAEFCKEVTTNYLGTTCDSRMEYIGQYIEPDISLDENIKQIVKKHRN